MSRTFARGIIFSLIPFNVTFFRVRNEIIFNILLIKILWSYHTTPHSNTKETPFKMIYGADTLFPVEINTPSPCNEDFNEEENKEGLRFTSDLIDEDKYISHIHEFAAK